MKTFIYADPMVLCYADGDDPPAGDSFDLNDPAGGTEDVATTDILDDKPDDKGQQKTAVVFTQDQVNKFLAEDRRKRETKVQTQNEQFKKMEDRLGQMISAAETTKEQKAMLEADLEDLRASQRTEQEQREHLAKQAKEKHDDEITTLKENGLKWEALYKTSMIQRSLLDAAAEHDVYNAEDIIDKLEKHTELRPDKDTDGNLLGTFSPRTAVKVKDENGETLTAWKTPSEAVAAMKANSEKHGNLFRSSVMAGIGGGTATTPGAGNAPVDGKNLSDDEWFKAAQENPDKFGVQGRHR